MSPFNPVFAVLVLALALASIRLIPWPALEMAPGSRYDSIDGLRGYLALFVFLHHSAVWYAYLRTDAWVFPPSRLYAQFGYGSVALFFMVTGFLFFSKLIDARRKPLDWTRLYVSRVLRLAPLYLVAMLLLAMVVAQLSNFSLHESGARLLWSALKWLAFTIAGQPALNGVAATANVTAQVTWSLAYEWFFYLSLPLLALSVRVVPPIPYLLLSACAVGGMILLKPEAGRLLTFTGGFIAAIVVRVPALTRYLRGAVAAVVAYGCLAAAAVAFPPADRPSALGLVLLAVAFIIIAAGNDLLGVLSTRSSRRLGEVSYSLYLLHGIVLFVAFRFVVGSDRAAALSPWGHWAVVLGCTPLLALLCCTSYELIERPPVRWWPAIGTWLQARFPRWRAVKPLPVPPPPLRS